MATLFTKENKQSPVVGLSFTTGQRPLADRMRPKDLSEFVGQARIVGKDKILWRLIEKDQVPSMIFWGPPGCGKTTLARIIAQKTKADFTEVRAIEKGVGDIKKIIAEAKSQFRAYQKRTILFVDEIHRFNKAQQAIFLPFVEEGTLILIGATTENPSFEIISPLLSRCRVFVLESLSPGDIGLIIKRALTDKERGLGKLKIKISPPGLNLLIEFSNGDARCPLNGLEVAIKMSRPDKYGVYHLTRDIIAQAMRQGF